MSSNNVLVKLVKKSLGFQTEANCCTPISNVSLLDSSREVVGEFGPLNIRLAEQSDWAQITQLLQDSNLPTVGAQEHLPNFVTAWRGSVLVGCAGLENYGTVGLLRSVAVKPAERGIGLGQTLTQRMLTQAKEKGLDQVLLLTETAQEFFPRFGFQVINRTAVPIEATESAEFKGACCESAVVMALSLK